MCWTGRKSWIRCELILRIGFVMKMPPPSIEYLKPGHFFDEERLATLKTLAREALADGNIKSSLCRGAGQPTLTNAALRSLFHGQHL